MSASFYSNPVELHPDRHGRMGLRREIGFNFAAGVNAVPLGVAEVVLAAQWYPVVVAENPACLVAVTGLRPGENLFVDQNGAWTPGAYIPAYVRRYPFVLAGNDSGLTLCIDDKEDVLTEDGGLALFEGQEPTAMTRNAMAFCQSVHAGDAAARAFVEALRLGALMEGRSAEISGVGENVRMNGLLTISEKAFRDLPDETFLALRKAGWLPAIYAQIQSSLNWHRLSDLLVQRTAGGKS